MSLKPWNKERRYKTPMEKRLRNYRKGGSQLYKDIGLLTGHNTEIKWDDSEFTNTSVYTTATIFPLITLLRGTDAAGNRIGRSVKMLSLQWNVTFKLDPAYPADTIRLNIIKEDFVAGTSITYDGGTAKSVFQDSNLQAFRNLNNRKNIRVLYDKYINLTQEGTETQTRKYYKKFNFHTIFNSSNNADITDCQSGMLYMMFKGTNPSNVTTPTLASGYIRVRYVDD